MSLILSEQPFFGIPPLLLATLKVEREEDIHAVELIFINTELPRCNVIFRDSASPSLEIPVNGPTEDWNLNGIKTSIASGIPDWIGAAIGIQSRYLQKVTLQFSEDDFCLVCVEYIPSSRELESVGAAFKLSDVLCFFGSFKK